MIRSHLMMRLLGEMLGALLSNLSVPFPALNLSYWDDKGAISFTTALIKVYTNFPSYSSNLEDTEEDSALISPQTFSSSLKLEK